MNMTRTAYPNAAGYVKVWRKVKSLPDDCGYIEWADRRNLPPDGKGLKANFLDALHNRINHRGKLNMTGRRYQDSYQVDLFRDQMDLHNKLQKRVRVYQFRTDLVRRRFGHLLDDKNEL